jgi:hypothetical protein
MQPNEQFWVVWNPRGGVPVVIHNTNTSAVREAERLAVLNPGQRFYVLKGLRYAETQPVPSIIRELPIPMPDPPF